MKYQYFRTAEERKKIGSTDFISLRYCKLPAETTLKDKAQWMEYGVWPSDSLYSNEEFLFFDHYKGIFDCGISDELKPGEVYMWGNTYFEPALIDSIIEKLNNIKPLDYELLIDWLNKAKEYNGFYFQGV